MTTIESMTYFKVTERISSKNINLGSICAKVRSIIFLSELSHNVY